MTRTTVIAGLAGALVVLVVVGAFMALDRTTLHWYSGDDAPSPAVSASQQDASPRPTATSRRPAPAVLSTSDANSDRSDCAEIRGTPYRSVTERTWFLGHCVTPEPQLPLRVSPLQRNNYVPPRNLFERPDVPFGGGFTCNELWDGYTRCSGSGGSFTCNELWDGYTRCSGSGGSITCNELWDGYTRCY